MQEKEEWKAPKLIDLDLKNTAGGTGPALDAASVSSTNWGGNPS